MLKKLLTLVLPRRLKNNIHAYLKRQFQEDREIVENQIPKALLAGKHVANCELLLDREVLLSKLKKGACIAEIGVDRGVFTEKIIRITQPESIHLVDFWDSERYHDGLYKDVFSKFAPLVDEGHVKIHRKSSIDAVEDFEDDYFDWIYIDTDHSYQLTRDELLQYSSKIKEDGIITGHDYSMGNWVSAYRYGVIEAVHEFCVEHGWELIYLTLEPVEKQSFAIRRIQ